jgi:flagellar biosynthesis protein FlhF
MKDAIKAVKSEFGSQAVILRTKEKMVENNKVIEITAAVPDAPRYAGASVQADHSFSLQDAPDFDGRIERLEAKLQNFSETVAKKSQLQAIESGVEELKLLLMEALRQQNGSNLKDAPIAIVDIHRQLQVMGVEEAQIAQLVKFLRELPNPEDQSPKLPESPSEYYKSQAIRWMLKRIKLATKWQPSKGSMLVHAFVGPSGCGKTSLVAKLAASYARQHKCKVLAVSFDNQRLAAQEQLRVYSKILDVYFESIDSADELEGVLEKHRDCEIVLIDTAGHSPKNQSKIQDLTALSKLSLPIEFHLVLSVSEKAMQLDRSVRSFANLGISSLCFTKLDESWSYGEIFNLSSKWSIPLSFFSTGQRIPEDVERASKERVIERLFAL